MLRIITSVALLACIQALPSNVDLSPNPVSSPLHYNFVQRIAKDGYYSESHRVTTSDGYILEVNRIPHGRKNAGTGPKPVVLLMHGLQSSAISYISLGPERSLAYILADAGYDVFVGNVRGVLNSRYHVTLDADNPRDKSKFFDYSFENIGAEDLPAMIDYILKVTKQEKLHYVGHSQGGTIFLVLNSLKPAYNKKFISVHLLAGVGYQRYFPNTALSMLALSTNTIYTFAKSIGLLELLGPETNTEVKCSESTDDEACSLWTIKDIMGNIFGDLEVISGASIKQYAHYGQNIKAKKFKRWDYGVITNLIKYGSLSAPEFNLKLIDVDITMHYSTNDELLDEKDVLAMAADIPNAKVRKVSDNLFTHGDFLASPTAKELVFDYVVEKINEKHR